MRWLPGGWQRTDRTGADRVDPERATAPRGTAPEQPTVAHRGHAPHRAAPAEQEERTRAVGPATMAYDRGQTPPAVDRGQAPPAAPLLGTEACDVDVSAVAFRNLLVGGGVSGFLTVLCAAALVDNGGSVGLWLWQLLFGMLFLWFAFAARGTLSSRGFLLDRSGFYARTRGEIFGVSWEEIGAVGIGSLPLIQQKRPVHPERRQALEIYPADSAFAARHPELERWRVEEPAPMPGLPGTRYRFHLPPLSRLPRRLERAVQHVAPRRWVGQYRRYLPQQQGAA